MSYINTKVVTIYKKIEVWHYSYDLLKDQKLFTSGRNQYVLVKWLYETNKAVIRNDYISPFSSIKIPATQKDFIRLILFELKESQMDSQYFDLLEEKEERIIIIGTQQHRGGDFFTSQFINGGILGKDVSKYNKMMFVHQALREVRLNNDKKWTILLCTEGYTNSQLLKIKSAFYDKNEMKDCVTNIIEIGDNDLNSIINYINTSDIENNTVIRKRDYIKISHISIYAHGLPDGIYLWMDDVYPYQKAFDKKEIERLKKFAFSKDSKIYCYSCRTGVGDDSEDFTKKGSDPKISKSIAQIIANVTCTKVYAYRTRTSYEDTLVKREYRNTIESKDVSKEMQSKIPDYELLYDIWMTEKYIVDGAIFYQKGALNPVKSDSTPKGLTMGLCLYTSAT